MILPGIEAKTYTQLFGKSIPKETKCYGVIDNKIHKKQLLSTSPISSNSANFIVPERKDMVNLKKIKP